MSTTASLRVNLDRIKSDILRLAQIGRREDDRGIYRQAFTDADIEGKRWLAGQMHECDRAGSNISVTD